MYVDELKAHIEQGLDDELCADPDVEHVDERCQARSMSMLTVIYYGIAILVLIVMIVSIIPID